MTIKRCTKCGMLYYEEYGCLRYKDTGSLGITAQEFANTMLLMGFRITHPILVEHWDF